LVPSYPCADQSISEFEQAQALPAKIVEKASQNGRSNPALWAMIRSAGSIRSLSDLISMT
jgi:hypothetical protein